MTLSPAPVMNVERPPHLNKPGPQQLPQALHRGDLVAHPQAEGEAPVGDTGVEVTEEIAEGVQCRHRTAQIKLSEVYIPCGDRFALSGRSGT